MRKKTRSLPLNAFASALLLTALASTLWANSNLSGSSEEIASLRKQTITTEPVPPRMPGTENKDIKRVRNYPMQPPTIPHKIDGYAVNLNANKCLSCHNRTLTGDTQAPMVSVTHFMNREGNFLATVSPRRYFCNQCHVPQVEAKPLIENTFQDVNEVLKGVR